MVAGVKYFLNVVVLDASRVQHEFNLTLWARPWLEGQQDAEPAYQLLSTAVVQSPLSPPSSTCAIGGPAATSSSEPAAGPVTGGKQTIAVDDPATVAAAAMAVMLLNEQSPVLNGSAEGSLSLCSIQSAQSQARNTRPPA